MKKIGFLSFGHWTPSEHSAVQTAADDRLQSVELAEAAVRDVAQLRRGAETGPVTALPSMVVRALALTDGLCWDSLERGDTLAFACQAAICAELRDFGICARLLQER